MRIFSLALILFTLLAAPASAQVTPEQQQSVNDVQAYLGGLTTLRAHFTQLANDGKQQTGTFTLKRPGRLRIEYDAPVKDFIVADGLFIYYYDGDTKQTSNSPISRSLADFFLRRNLSLSGDISVSDVKKDKDTLQLTLVQTKNPLAGSLTLYFSQNPLQLQQWQVVDAQGLVTTIKLQDIETGIALDNAQFHYVDPAHKGQMYNGN